MGQLNLAVVVGQEPGLGALEDAELAALETGCVALRDDPVAPCLDADHADMFVTEKRMEQPDGIRSPADAGDKQVRKPAFALKDLLPSLHPDHAVKIADNHRERVGTQRGADDVMGVFHAGHPVAHRFVDGFLEGCLPGRHGADFRAHQAHPRDVERLPLHIDLAHVNDALHPEAGADRCRRDTVLAGSRFRDDAGFPEPLRQQDLAEGVVDLVGASVEQVLALEVNLRPTEFLRPTVGEIERGWPPDVVFQQIIELGLESGVGLRLGIRLREILQGRHQCLGDEHPPELSEVAF